uniref:Secreted protein n=1 Tax=Ascaris lumbricoides TaxID=6252 RepID=A0A0M3ICW3_ASCLU
MNALGLYCVVMDATCNFVQCANCCFMRQSFNWIWALLCMVAEVSDHSTNPFMMMNHEFFIQCFDWTTFDQRRSNGSVGIRTSTILSRILRGNEEFQCLLDF